MKRQKIVNTTATEAPTERAEPQNMREVEDPFEYFRDETQEVLINVRRLEPVTERGQHVAGHLPSLSLSPDEARDLAKIFLQRPGYGGGNYAIQCQRQKANGGYEFASSFRFRVAGPSRALELFESPPQPQAAPQAPAAQSPMHFQHPPPWYYQQPAPQAPAQPQGLSMQDVPRLLETLTNIVRAQPSSPIMGQMDIVQLIGSLQKTVQPEDELTKLAKFAGIIDKLRGRDAPAEATGQPIDWASAAVAIREFLRPQPQAQPPNVYRPAPAAAPMQIPNPPGLRWDGQQWIDERAPNPEPAKAEEVEEEDEEDEEDETFDADSMTEFFKDAILKMSPEEQEKMKDRVKQMAAMF